jgi:hypothetical protein
MNQREQHPTPACCAGLPLSAIAERGIVQGEESLSAFSFPLSVNGISANLRD